MLAPIIQFIQYIHYYLTAANKKGHGIHSPFVFNMVHEVLLDDRIFYFFEEIKYLSFFENESQKKSKKYNQLLFKCIHYYKPTSVTIITGNSLLEACYIAAANTKTTIHFTQKKSLAELPEILKNRVKIIHDKDAVVEDQTNWYFTDFDHVNDGIVSNIQSIIATNNPTICVVIKNPHHSKVARHFYQQLQQSIYIKLSIDLFGIAFLFCRKEHFQKEHFSIQY
ncbi:MAG: hypothetical protein ACOVNY_01990 [Chitinophagaceae bacterium]